MGDILVTLELISHAVAFELPLSKFLDHQSYRSWLPTKRQIRSPLPAGSYHLGSQDKYS